MKQSEAIKFYSRRDVASFIAQVSQDREVAVQLHTGNFGKRPQIIQFPKDISTYARDGATSFHISQERWRNPLKLSEADAREKLNELRIGWDFIIDIDSPDFKISTIAAE